MIDWPIDGAEQRVLSPRTNDVLCQRGRAAFAHEGNLYFRAIIDARMPCYQAAHDRIKKSLIVAEIVQHILNRGGRFLKRNANKDHWTVASQRDAKDKVSYALRRSAIGDNREKFHKGYYSSDEEGSVGNGSNYSFDLARREQFVIKNDNKLCYVDMASRNDPGCSEDEVAFEELLEDYNFEKSFGALIDSYNDIPLEKLTNDEE